MEKLRKQGYDRAKKIEAGAYSRVVVASCPTEAEAAALVREVRKTTKYKDACLWKQERK